MSGENYLRAAYSYLYIGEFDRASEAFRRAMAEDPENPTYYFYGSVTALRNGQTELALTWAREAVRLAPADALYRAHCCMVESAQCTEQGAKALADGALDAARSALQDAILFDPLNDEAFALLQQIEPQD